MGGVKYANSVKLQSRTEPRSFLPASTKDHRFPTGGRLNRAASMLRQHGRLSMGIAMLARRSPFLTVANHVAHYSAGQSRHFNWTEKLPRIIRPSFWSSVYPGVGRWLRERKTRKKDPVVQDKPWNPATFYFWMFVLIGSQSMNMVALENDYSLFSRKADAKISLLREVLEKVQRGEEVDIERTLGTGDEAQEREWKEGKSISIDFERRQSAVRK